MFRRRERLVLIPSQNLSPNTPIHRLLIATTGVVFPASGKYANFDWNYERFAATELNKRSQPDKFGKKGFMLQAIAAGWHCLDERRLNELGDTVGRERIMVLHGTKDNMSEFFLFLVDSEIGIEGEK
jgi:hypothetical protein